MYWMDGWMDAWRRVLCCSFLLFPDFHIFTILIVFFHLPPLSLSPPSSLLFLFCSLVSSCSAFPRRAPCSAARHNAQADHNADPDVDPNADDNDEDDRDVLLFCPPCSGGRAGRANA